jgi:uncharacterized membrane protein YhhN
VSLALLAPAAALLGLLLWAERGRRPGRVLLFKAPLSGLFIAACLLQPRPDAAYFGLVLAGLVLGLAGDVLLALPRPAAFRAGLASFLLGHLAYVAAFARLTAPSDWVVPGVVLLWAAAWLVFRWLRPHLGGLRAPVAAYVVVITLMVWAAWAAFHAGGLAPPGGLLAVFGALAFYLSDIFVARDRFLAPGWENRLLGLPLYYAGQFCLAFSVGFAGA